MSSASTGDGLPLNDEGFQIMAGAVNSRRLRS
jgi:hypothetical protein